MAQVKEETVLKWLKNFPEMFYEHNSGTIYCSKCETHFNAIKHIFLRHVSGKVHTGKQRATQSSFYFDLITFLIMCNIPWSQLNNTAFHQFFEKYLCKCTDKDRTLPSESLLRKVYLTKLYDKKVQEIHAAIENNKIWISVDETTNFMGRNILHLLVRPLTSNVPGKCYLLASKVLEVVNGKTVALFVEESLRNMWGHMFEQNLSNVLILCSDSAAYMLSTGRILKTIFPNMKHVTCLAHALHRVAEKIREEFKNVDAVISNVKKIFLKAPNRVKTLKEHYSSMPLPPEPVITRWGTWLTAAFYYDKYFNEITHVISLFNEKDAQAIKKAKAALSDQNLRHDISFIKEYFGVITFAILKLENTKLSVTETIETFDTARAVIDWSSREGIINKVEQVMDRNPDLDFIMDKRNEIESSTDEDSLIKYYKYAPLTSVDVERSFSLYKWIFNVKRSSLTVDNAEKIIVIYYNSDVAENYSGDSQHEEE